MSPDIRDNTVCAEIVAAVSNRNVCFVLIGSLYGDVVRVEVQAVKLSRVIIEKVNPRFGVRGYLLYCVRI